MSDFTSSPWVGRNDGPGPEHARWHSTIQDLDELDDAPGVALIGFASDEGVRRNHMDEQVPHAAQNTSCPHSPDWQSTTTHRSTMWAPSPSITPTLKAVMTASAPPLMR